MDIPQMVTLRHWRCTLVISHYHNGRPAIGLVSDEGPVTTATVNVPDYPLTDRQVLIKDYSENAGLLDALTDAGIVRSTGAICRVGHASAAVCELLVDFPSRR